MSAAYRIPDEIVNKITLSAYELSPHPCAIIWCEEFSDPQLWYDLQMTKMLGCYHGSTSENKRKIKWVNMFGRIIEEELK